MKLPIKALVGVVVAVVVFSAMLPLATGIIATSGATGTTATLMGYIPMFLILGLVLGLIAVAVVKFDGDGAD